MEHNPIEESSDTTTEPEIPETTIADPTPENTGILVSAELRNKRYSIRTGMLETDEEEQEREVRQHMFDEVDESGSAETIPADSSAPLVKTPLQPRNVKQVFLLMSTELADFLFANTDITLPRSSLKGFALAEANKTLKALDPDAELVGSTLGGLEIAQKDEDIWSEPADHIQCLFVDEEEKHA